MSKKFRLLMALVLITGLFGGMLTASTVSADPDTGTMIEIPRIDLGDVFGSGDWDTKIQIQNVGDDTWVNVDFWPGWTETCPPTTDTHIGHAEMFIPAGGVWTLHNAIPDGAESAFIWSCELDPTADPPDNPSDTNSDDCAPGSPLAVTVDRWGPDPSGAVELSSSYTGIADPTMVDPGPPYEYYAPYVMHGYNNLDTTITIQNSGDICASIWIYYKEEDNCEMQKAQHIEQIRPGESIRIGPGTDADVAFPSPELDAPWLGSAYVTANVPLAIVVDQLSQPPSENQGTLLSMRGLPFDWEGQGETNWYADLLYREISGYTSSIQVQNLTQDSKPTFVTVQFFDQSGDEILFVGDWICRNGAKTFYLPAIVDLGINFPFGYVGAAEIQSSEQVDYPGNIHEGEPIFAVVDIKKTKVWDGAAWRHTVAGETQGGAYNAHPEHQKENAWGWAMPFIAKEQEGVTSRIAIRNNSNCVKINGVIEIFDETGRVVAIIPGGWLQPKHMTVKDLNYFGQIYPGFLGAATYTVTAVEQLCDLDGDGETDILPVMPSVVVLNYGYEQELDPFNPVPSALPQTTLGDLTRVYEGIPYGHRASDCIVEFSGTVIDEETLDPIDEVDVYTAVVDEGPFTAIGIAYVDEDCGDTGPARLAEAYVELQIWDDDDDEWDVEDDTTTSSAGQYEFGNALELGEWYRIKIFVEENPNTVSYVSDSFVAVGDVEMDFTIDTDGGEIDLGTGAWCDADITTDVVYTLQAETDSTGYYSFDYDKIAEAEDINVVTMKSGYWDEWEFPSGVVCDDQVVNFELNPECDTVGVFGNVEDKETGLPIEGATVWAMNLVDGDFATTDADGNYSIEIDFDPDATTWVTVSADGYNPSTDSVFIPICDLAIVDFQLHQTPMSRILLYYGNGGDDDGTGYNTAADMFDLTFGYEVDYTDDWPPDPDLEEYKVIFLLGPGNPNDDPASDNFTPAQITQLDLFLRNGGRLVVMTEASEEVTVENTLVNALNDLDLSFAFNPEVSIANAMANDISADQLMDNVATLDFDTAAEVSIFAGDPGDLARLPGGQVMVAADTMPGITRGGTPAWDGTFAGDVVLITDLAWMDDASFMGTIEDLDEDGVDDYVWPDWPADNENLLLNIITFQRQ